MVSLLSNVSIFFSTHLPDVYANPWKLFWHWIEIDSKSCKHFLSSAGDLCFLYDCRKLPCFWWLTAASKGGRSSADREHLGGRGLWQGRIKVLFFGAFVRILLLDLKALLVQHFNFNPPPKIQFELLGLRLIILEWLAAFFRWPKWIRLT